MRKRGKGRWSRLIFPSPRCVLLGFSTWHGDCTNQGLTLAFPGLWNVKRWTSQETGSVGRVLMHAGSQHILRCVFHLPLQRKGLISRGYVIVFMLKAEIKACPLVFWREHLSCKGLCSRSITVSRRIAGPAVLFPDKWKTFWVIKDASSDIQDVYKIWKFVVWSRWWPL